MNRRLIVICAVMFFVALAVPAFAAVQNVKVSGDITASVVDRVDLNLGLPMNGTGAAGGKDDSRVIMSQVRLRVDADLTDNVSTTIRLINERDWNDEDPTRTTNRSTNDKNVDIDLAYVTLKEMLYSPLTVMIGRQELHYGNDLIVGDSDTNRQDLSNTPDIQNRDLSLRKAFDAVRAVLNYDPLTIDLIYAKINDNTKISAGVTREKDDTNLYGAYAKYKMGDKYNSIVEGYFWQKRDDRRAINQHENASVINVPGFRIVTNPIKGLNLQAEQAWQFGNLPGGQIGAGANVNYDRDAMMSFASVNYALQVERIMKYAPVIGAWFVRYSGDKNPGDSNPLSAAKKRYTAWDPMFENANTGTIYNVLFDTTNARIVNGNLSIKPIEDVTAKVDYAALWLDKKWPRQAGASTLTIFQTGGGTITQTMNDGKSFLGQEVDGTLTYDYTEDVQFTLLGSVYLPGKAIGTNSASDNTKNPKQIIGSCKVTF